MELNGLKGNNLIVLTTRSYVPCVHVFLQKLFFLDMNSLLFHVLFIAFLISLHIFWLFLNTMLGYISQIIFRRQIQAFI